MTSPKGEPTNAVFGFIRDLKQILNDKKPTHMILALEGEGPGERAGLYADYKANRSEMPADLRPQIPRILEVAEGLGIPTFRHAGWEADDVIATLARQAVEDGFEVRIVTSDKDARQLINDKVKLYNCRKNQVLDAEFLLDDWGIRPDQVIDFQGLVGDTSDNIPGVPKIGPKTATELLQKWDTLDAVLENANEVSKKVVRENLITYADQARLSRQLATLKTDLPLAFDWHQAEVTPPHADRLLGLFNELGFRRYAEEMREALAVSAAAAELTDEADTGLFAPENRNDAKRENPPALVGAAALAVVPIERTWTTVRTPEAFAKFAEEFKRHKRFCLDLETTDLDPNKAEIVGWAISWEAGNPFYLPVKGPEGEQLLSAEDVLAVLKPHLEDPQSEFVNQNLKYELIVLRRAGINVAGLGMDPMVADYLLDAGARSHGLDTLALRYLNRKMIPITELIGKGKNQKRMDEVEVEKVAEYAGEDADISLQLADLLTAKLKEEHLWDLYWELERPLIPVLADLEFNGIRIDTDELKRQSEELTARLDQVVTEIHELAGREFNISSPKQLQEVLFKELKLPVIKRTKTGPSTDAEVLEKLALQHDHPLPAKIIEHRTLSKLKGTYVDALPLLVNPKTGNVHCSFNQTVAATGRLSSSEPNLQNIPIRTEEGRRIRKAFIPSEAGWVLLAADYSQIELRMLAHFSDDETLTTAFQEGKDIHAAVAADIFGVPVEEVTSDMRRIAKTVNFGVIYGQTPFGLAAVLGISQTDAATFIDEYLARYTGVAKLLRDTLSAVRNLGYARTILGRRRDINGIRPNPGPQLNLPERTAFNAVIQGSAADLIKQAMLNIAARLRREKFPARMLLQIHDELVFETPADQAEALAAMVREEMSGAMTLKVPLAVDVGIGPTWFDTK